MTVGSRRLSRRSLWLGGAAAVVALAALTTYAIRTDIADLLVSRQLAASGVEATYRVEQVSLTHQRLTAVRIGRPDQPDLLAQEMDVWLGYGWEGPRIDRVRMRGVRLRGRFDGQTLSFGQVDRLMPAADDAPFTLPDIALDIADAQLVVATPWGPLAAGVVLDGNPLRRMSGHIAAQAPRLAIAGCQVSQTSLSSRIRSDGADLRLRGPLRAAGLACGAQDIRAREVVADADLTIPVGLGSVQWSGDMSAAELVRDGVMLEQLAGRTTGNWLLASNRASGFVTARSRNVRGLPGIASGAAAIRGDFAQAGGRWQFGGGAAMAGMRLSREAAAYGGQLGSQRTAPLVGPLLAQWGAAMNAAGREFRVSAPFRLVSTSGRTGLSIRTARLKSASGAELTMQSADTLARIDDRGFALNGEFRLSGGGFPRLSGSIERAKDGRLMLSAAPFRTNAGDAALAVDRLDVAADAQGNGRFVVAAGVSGPLPGGRVDGLQLPLVGQFAAGRFSVESGCRDIRYSRIRQANAVIGAGGVRACSLPGQPLLAYGPGGLRGGLMTGPLAFRGLTGGTELNLAADGLRLDLGRRNGELRGVDIAIGAAGSGSRLNAERVTVRSLASAWGGDVIAGTAQIGPVPLAMRDIAGPWRWQDGALTLDAAMTVADTASSARFAPVTVTDARLRYRDGTLAATGVIRSGASPTPLANLDLTHRFTASSGEANFTLIPIRFATGGLQPQDLTDLARGVVANVDGVVTGTGRFVWDSAGVRSSGRFSTDDTDLAAAFGPVAGLSGTITFDDLLGLTTPPGQQMQLASVNPGIEVVDGRVSYQLVPDRRVRIEGGQWPFAGGTLRLLPGLLDYGADQPRYLSFDVEGVDAARFLQRYGFENITATGVFDGVIPTVFDGNGGRVVGGSLVVRDGGGSLAYVGELSNRDLGYFGNLAFGALRSVEYDSLVIRLNGNIDGEMLTEVSFTGLGQGPGVTNNFLTRQLARLPFAFNIRINAPFRQLLTSARSLYDPTVLIDQNLPTLLEAEAAQRARQAAERAAREQRQDGADVPSVQQQESGDGL